MRATTVCSQLSPQQGRDARAGTRKTPEKAAPQVSAAERAACACKTLTRPAQPAVAPHVLGGQAVAAAAAAVLLTTSSFVAPVRAHTRVCLPWVLVEARDQI